MITGLKDYDTQEILCDLIEILLDLTLTNKKIKKN
jgi:hypothetical protein